MKKQDTTRETKPQVVPAKKIGEIKGFGSYYVLEGYSAEIATTQLQEYMMNSREWLMAHRYGIETWSSRGAYGGMVGDCLVTYKSGPLLIVRDALKHLPDLKERSLRGLERVFLGKAKGKYDHGYTRKQWKSDLELNNERLTMEEYDYFKQQGIDDKAKEPEERRVFVIERKEMETPQEKIREVMFSRGSKTRLGNIWQFQNIIYGDLQGALPRFLFRDKLPELLNEGDPEGDWFETGFQSYSDYPHILPMDIQCKKGPGFRLESAYWVGSGRTTLFSEEEGLSTEITNPVFIRHIGATQEGYESYAHMQKELREKEKERRQEEHRVKTLARIATLCRKNKVSVHDLTNILEPNRRSPPVYTESQSDYEDRIMREAYRIERDRRDDINRSF